MMTVNGIEIGHCVYGTEVGIVDYSRKDRNPFGEIEIIERGYSDVVRYKVEVETNRLQIIKDTLAGVRAVHANYVGHTDFSVIAVPEGYLNSFSITIDNWKISSLTLEVEGDVVF